MSFFDTSFSFFLIINFIVLILYYNYYYTLLLQKYKNANQEEASRGHWQLNIHHHLTFDSVC
tara:strand:+ start:10 stop:195 length:186 start_codon:yes stop_codon:yes gene_type:complete